jgi:hypothetical protein
VNAATATAFTADMEQQSAIMAFNRGLISSLGLARVDIQRTDLSAEVMTNYIPRVLGSMALRPGLEYIASTHNNSPARMFDFVFSTSGTAILELTDSIMRVIVDDVLVTRPSVSSAVTNGTFTQYSDTVTMTIAAPGVVTYTDAADIWANDDPVVFTTTGALPTGLTVGTTYYVVNLTAGANTFEVSATVGGGSIATTGTQSGVHTASAAYHITGWTDSDEVGGASSWVTGDSLQLVGSGTAAAIRDQQVTVAAGDIGTEHALKVVVARGPIEFNVGSSLAGEEYITKTTLREGEHSLAFTPTGDFYIRFLSRLQRITLVSSCDVEAAGIMTVATPWAEADLDNVRKDQSADVLFCACKGKQQRRIERRNTRSWSVVKYQSDDGPLKIQNVTSTTITASGLTGNITLTASTPTFRALDVGELFSITSVGQVVTASLTAQNTFTDTIRVTGVSVGRAFTLVLSGLTGTGTTATLQQSADSATGPWVDYTAYTTDQTISVNDALTNQIVYYRLGIKTGGYVAGTIVSTLDFPSGAITGTVRITGFTTDLLVDAEVIKSLGGTTATDTWAEGAWSDYKGWPTSVSLHEGRLWWAGLNSIVGSVADAYDSFDPEYVGDAGPIDRTIGAGPVDTVNWMISLQSLMVGTQGTEFSARASILGEILTPLSFSLKGSTNQGSSAVQAVAIDQSGIFVNRSGTKVFEINFNASSYNFDATDLTMLVPELGATGIVRMAAHRQPDTRIHCVKSDGTVMMAVTDKNENTLAWVTIETDGVIEDVITLPALAGEVDDRVYYVVRRVINGSTVRYIEKFAQELECRGGQLNKQADSFVSYTGTATAVITGLSHLEGETVVVWADGADVGTVDASMPWTQTYTVSGGQITLASAASNVVVGLPYTAQFKSTKLGSATQYVGTPLNQNKRISYMGIIAENMHKKGLKFGPDFVNMDDMPGIERGTAVTSEVSGTYDEELIEFDGAWATDARICIESVAPRPVTLLALTYTLDM